MSSLRRYSPMKPSRGTEIPQKLRDQVAERDRLCVGYVIGMPGECQGQPELDHVRASGALGRKSRTSLDNLVRLCSTHHREKTNNGRLWRPVLLDYIAGRPTAECSHVDRNPACDVCARRLA